jgi:hypothetical protein
MAVSSWAWSRRGDWAVEVVVEVVSGMLWGMLRGGMVAVWARMSRSW